MTKQSVSAMTAVWLRHEMHHQSPGDLRDLLQQGAGTIDSQEAEIERMRAALAKITHRWICRLHNTKAYRERTWEERALAAESERDEMYQIANAALAEGGANEPVKP
jgi:hypothetical protein